MAGNHRRTAALPDFKKSGPLQDFDNFAAYCKSQGAYSLQIPKVIVSYAKDGERMCNDVINRLTPAR